MKKQRAQQLTQVKPRLMPRLHQRNLLRATSIMLRAASCLLPATSCVLRATCCFKQQVARNLLRRWCKRGIKHSRLLLDKFIIRT